MATRCPLMHGRPDLAKLGRFFAAAAVVFAYLGCILAGSAPARAQQTATPIKAVSGHEAASQETDPQSERASESTFSDWTVRVQVGALLPLSPSPFSNRYHPGAGLDVTGSTPLGSGLHLEAGGEYQRYSPSEPNPLVGALPQASVEGVELSITAVKLGVRYEISGSLPVQPYVTAHAGGSWTHVAEAGTGMRTVASTTELSPWLGAAVGMHREVSSRLSVVLAPGGAVALTDTESTYSFSVKGGLWISL